MKRTTEESYVLVAKELKTKYRNAVMVAAIKQRE
jgi:hypothetical protein